MQKKNNYLVTRIDVFGHLFRLHCDFESIGRLVGRLIRCNVSLVRISQGLAHAHTHDDDDDVGVNDDGRDYELTVD